MFQRNALLDLRKWKKQAIRKPLVLRGARQVGKTSIVNIFAQDFSQYIYLNLELPNDRALFENSEEIDILVQAIFLTKRKNAQNLDTLLFIDEIQHILQLSPCFAIFMKDILSFT